MNHSAGGRRYNARWSGLPALPGSPKRPAIDPRFPGTTFVGRAPEVERVLATFESALAGRGGVTFVSGEPGIGKTRLISEVTARAEAMGFRVFRGNCYQAEESVAYRPWAEVIRALHAGDPDGFRSASARAENDGAFRVAPELRPSKGVASSAADQLQMFDGFTDFLQHVAEKTPIVIAIEDLHWADRSTVALLQHFSRRLSASAIAIVASFRDAEVGPEHPLAAVLGETIAKRAGERIDLDSLDLASTRELVGSVLGVPGSSVRARLADAVYQQAEGNPFFIQEVCRHLAETGRIAGVGDTRDLAGDETLSLPAGVKALLELRLQVLTPLARSVLAAGAVLGRQFEFEVLKRTTGLEEEALLEALDAADRAKLIRAVEGRQTEYEFAHALVQQTLLESVSGVRVQRLHLDAARAIESVHANATERYASQLAAHYRASRSAADLPKALSYGSVAMGQAAEAFAWDELVSVFEQTLEAMERLDAPPAQQAEFIDTELYPRYNIWVFPLQRMRELARFAGGALTEAGHTEAAARMLLVEAFSYQSHFERALQDFPMALALLERTVALSTEPGVLGMAKILKVSVLHQMGRGGEAYSLAVELRLDDEQPLIRCVGVALEGLCLSQLRRLAEAEAALQLAWDESAKLEGGVLVGALVPLWYAVPRLRPLRAPKGASNLIDSESKLRRVSRFTRETFEVTSFGIQREQGHVLGVKPQEYIGLGHSQGAIEEWCFREGMWAEVVAEMTRHHFASPDRSGLGQLGARGATLGEFLRVAGRFPEAETFLAESARADNGIHLVSGEACHGLICAEAGRFDEMRTHARAARDLMTDEDWLGLGARVTLLDSLVALVDGENAKAETLFDHAVSEIRRVENPWDEADAHYVLGTVLWRLEEPAPAAGHFEAAVAIYERIEASQPFFERVYAAWPGGRPTPERRVAGSDLPGGLSERESQVLSLLVQGYSNRRVAEQLLISTPTVATHVRHILEKTGTANRTEAAAWAVREGFG